MAYQEMSSASPSLQPPSNFNNILNSGAMANSASATSQDSTMSPADSAINSIGGLILQLQQISSSYPGVGDAEKQVAIAALQKYLEKVSGSLNSPQTSSGDSISPDTASGY